MLAGCIARTELLETQNKLTKELDELYELCIEESREYSDVEIARIEQITEELQDVDQSLSQFDKDVRDVTRILVGLGFHDGEDIGPDGAPSLRRKDELIVDASSLALNSILEVRDNVDEEWLRGVVTSIDPLLIQPDGWSCKRSGVESRFRGFHKKQNNIHFLEGFRAHT